MACLKFYFVFVLSVCVTSATSLNILALFPQPGRSHFNVFEPLLQALAEKGHNLTVISPFPQKTPLPRYRDISIEDDTDIIFYKFDIQMFQTNSMAYLWAPFKIAEVAKDLCLVLRTKPIQEFLKEDNKFDLIITELFNNDCYLGFVHKFKVPFIGLGPNIIMPWTNTMFANPANPAYIPANFLPVSDRMTFKERLLNTFMYVFSNLMNKFYIEYPSYEEAKLHFGNDLPPLDEISRNCSLMLVNSHFSLNLPRPLVPNVVEVGGMFISKPKSLPQNIEKFISESKDGVIFMSMGSMMKGDTFPQEKLKIFMKVFSKLKQRILWKWESDMPNRPSNVMVYKWLPQSDVLCHPNVLAFISHGGLLSTSETVHCGKPAIIVPQYSDQFPNSKAMEANKVGIVLNLAEVTEDELTNAVNNILAPSFRNRAQKLSEIFRDRPLSALDTAIYWVEYVGRHGYSHHMRSAAVHLPLYQYLLLDVVLFVVGCLLTVMFVIYYTLKVVMRLLFGRKSKQLKTKKVKKN